MPITSRLNVEALGLTNPDFSTWWEAGFKLVAEDLQEVVERMQAGPVTEEEWREILYAHPLLEFIIPALAVIPKK